VDGDRVWVRKEGERRVARGMRSESESDMQEERDSEAKGERIDWLSV
jgi:hypothetical protein